MQARRIYPQFGVRTLIPAYTGPADNDVEARSTYNGVYVSVQKRFSHGLQFQASYTRSRFESNNDASLGETGTDGSSQRPQSFFDIDADWSVSQFDVPNRFVVSYTYEIPGPKSGVLRQILGGWQFSGHHGVPVRPAVHDRHRRRLERRRHDGLRPAEPGQRDARLGQGAPGLHEQRLRGSAAREQQPADGQLDSATARSARNTERAASYWNTDLSLLKRFYLFGDRQLIIRADAFNAFNQDNYGIPVTNMSSTSFGKNAGGAAPNGWGRRIVTLSAKFSF